MVLQVGGLADVVAGLGKALQTKGHLVEIVLPKYDCMQLDQITNLKVCACWLAMIFFTWFRIFNLSL